MDLDEEGAEEEGACAMETGLIKSETVMLNVKDAGNNQDGGRGEHPVPDHAPGG